MKSVKIIYTSIGGNTEIVCQEIQKVLTERGIQVVLEKCQLAKLATLFDKDVLVFSCPTYAHGELQAYFTQFLETVKDENFRGKPVAVIGLGDPKYDKDYNIESAMILENWLAERGADMIVPALKVNRSPVPQLENLVKDWAESLAEALG